MTPKIVDERVCPNCGVLQLSTTSVASFPRCTDCGADLRPPDNSVTIDMFSRHTKDQLDAGAAYFRELVATIRSKKRDP